MADAGSSTSTMNGPGWTAFEARKDLEVYGDNAHLLFVADLRLNFDDVDTFASTALTDGSNDKKCDLVSVDRDAGVIVVAQGFVKGNPDGKAPPANKATDLNAAVSWLLAGDLDQVPETLRSAAIEARDALRADEITEIQIWFTHNMDEVKNVDDELDQARKTADALVRQNFPDAAVDVTYAQVGRKTLEADYKKIQATILVTDEIEFPIVDGFETAGTSWSAYNTAILATDLRQLWKKHGTLLMSPNIRDYLGVRKSERNINFGIKKTAKERPEDFQIFNNGITAMVHEFKVEGEGDTRKLVVTGLGIVNGGQTTGSIGTLADADVEALSRARVQVRFVKSSDLEIMESVVRYNNTQNKVETTDFRSKDAVQDRLRAEFEKVPDAQYRGGRRGGVDDAIKRDRSVLPDSSVAQALAAFHGEPNLAYNELRQIWDNDATYARFFNEFVSARHIVFCYSLLKAVEKAKLDISSKDTAKRTKAETGHTTFFSNRGSSLLLVGAIGLSVETILGRAVVNNYELQFKQNLSPEKARELWQPIVAAGLAFSSRLTNATNLGLKNQDRVKQAITDFTGLIEATRDADTAKFDTFADVVLPAADKT